MASEALLSSLMQVGVTGAGLVLAVYGLILPISRKMFLHRSRLVRTQTKLLEEKRAKLTSEAAKNELNQLKKLEASVGQNRRFPVYLSWGVALTFVLYILMALSGFLALFNPLNNNPVNDAWIMVNFALANVSFLFIGVFSVLDISRTLKREYETVLSSDEPQGI